jgi:putative oxidoreductase
MKKILNVHSTSTGIDIAILIARVGIAALMLTHGLPKMAMLFSGEPVQFPALFGLSAELSLSLAVFAEVLCSIFLLTGFGTRLAVIPLITTMVVALFFIHAADPFAQQEPASQYLLVYVILLFTGSGKYSIDYLLQRKPAKIKYTKTETNDPTLSIYR